MILDFSQQMIAVSRVMQYGTLRFIGKNKSHWIKRLK